MARKRKKFISWKDFRIRYELEVARVYMKGSSEDRLALSLNTLERICKPNFAVDIDAGALNKYIAEMEQEGYARSTIITNLSYIKPMLDWGYASRLIPRQVIYNRRLLRNMRRQGPPSRAVAPHEFDLILSKVDELRPNDAKRWKKLLRGMNNCDLRLSEILSLSWEPEAKVRMLMLGDRPIIQFCTSDAQKNGRIISHAVSKKFWEIARCDENGVELDMDMVEGHIFPLLDDPTCQMHQESVSRIIRQLGRMSGVVTNEHTGAYATSKDIGRKAYIEKLRSSGIGVFELRKLVRHASIETTTKYYDFTDAYELGKHIGWENKNESGSS